MKFRMIFILILVTTCLPELIFSQNYVPEVNGYIQVRYSNDYYQRNDFMIRRAKLWVAGKIPVLDTISYKIQLVYRSYKDEAIMFQDAYADVMFHKIGYLRAGRFVPDFLLQRVQPDYEIPVLERAIVINSLIQNPQTFARQIGVQLTYQTKEFPVHLSFGLFNGNGQSPGLNKGRDLLYTLHTQLSLVKNDETFLEVGASGSYRHADSITMNTIYASNVYITGNDYRWGFETQFNYKNFSFQSEFVQANINKDRAWGYYGLFAYNLFSKLQATGWLEKYTDLIPASNNNEWYGMGLNYYFTSKTKLMADSRIQFSSIKNNYLSELQFQVFFK